MQQDQLINNLTRSNANPNKNDTNHNFFIDLQPLNKNSRNESNMKDFSYNHHNYNNLTKIILHTNTIFGPGM